jgi:hypothetical protein
MCPIDPKPPRPPDPPKSIGKIITYPFDYMVYVIKLLKWNKK